MRSNIKTKLDNMIGKTFMYNTHHYKILSYEQTEDGITIVTDKKWLRNIDPEAFIKDCLPVEEKLPANTEKPETVVALQSISNGTISELKNILLENIKKVKTDKDYIPQAQAVNKNVDSIIDLARAEIETYKLAKQLTKMKQ